jgi:hypothetical protein
MFYFMAGQASLPVHAANKAGPKIKKQPSKTPHAALKVLKCEPVS